jgi:hypothetical protein
MSKKAKFKLANLIKGLIFQTRALKEGKAGFFWSWPRPGKKKAETIERADDFRLKATIG